MTLLSKHDNGDHIASFIVCSHPSIRYTPSVFMPFMLAVMTSKHAVLEQLFHFFCQAIENIGYTVGKKHFYKAVNQCVYIGQQNQIFLIFMFYSYCRPIGQKRKEVARVLKYFLHVPYSILQTGVPEMSYKLTRLYIQISKVQD